jgi:hypothetical protein
MSCKHVQQIFPAGNFAGKLTQRTLLQFLSSGAIFGCQGFFGGLGIGGRAAAAAAAGFF